MLKGSDIRITTLKDIQCRHKYLEGNMRHQKDCVLPDVASVASWSLRGVMAYWLGSGAAGSRA